MSSPGPTLQRSPPYLRECEVSGPQAPSRCPCCCLLKAFALKGLHQGPSSPEGRKAAGGGGSLSASCGRRVAKRRSAIDPATIRRGKESRIRVHRTVRQELTVSCQIPVDGNGLPRC